LHCARTTASFGHPDDLRPARRGILKAPLLLDDVMTEPSEPKVVDAREAARALTSDAMRTLTDLMNKGASEHARIAAAAAILDRGHGKPGQAGKTGGDEASGPLVFRWADKASEATSDPAQRTVCSSREPPQT
jgi:hypothetical protein